MSLHDLREQLGADLLELVPDMYGGTVPNHVLLMGGSTLLDKKRIVGIAIFNWISKKRKAFFSSSLSNSDARGVIL